MVILMINDDHNGVWWKLQVNSTRELKNLFHDVKRFSFKLTLFKSCKKEKLI